MCRLINANRKKRFDIFVIIFSPFSDWSIHINKPVYSIDGKRLGLLRKTSSDYMIITGDLINLSRYFVPKSMAESAIKGGIKLSITIPK